MQYTISMTSRMLALAALCIFLLCVLLFLLGVELGKRFAEPPPPAPAIERTNPAEPAPVMQAPSSAPISVKP
jgi:hypothetical protein